MNVVSCFKKAGLKTYKLSNARRAYLGQPQTMLWTLA
jgi:hypothetical protein